MKRRMGKILCVGAMALAAISLSGVGQVSGTTVLEEKPLAGLTLSMDHYCEAVIQTAQEDAMEAAQEDADAATQAAATATQSPDEKTDTSKSTVSSSKLGYKNLGLADVDTYLNVRKHASQSSKIIGKMTKNAGCEILSIKKGWAKIRSGKVKGYVKASYILRGDEAKKKAVKVARLKAIVKTQTLNVRYLPTTDARIYDQISEDEDYVVEKYTLTEDYMKSYIKKHCSKKDVSGVDLEEMYEDLDNWVMLSIDDEKVFVSREFITTKYRLNHAVSIKSSSKKSSSSSSGASSIVSYAMQFLGNRYVWGGTSLTNGTDCSGFTMSIYRHFGVSLPRTSAAQAAATTSVSSSDVQVGDLFFYGSGRVSHVALYIGNGQIIHASNARDGIKISSAYYRQPLKIGRVG